MNDKNNNTGTDKEMSFMDHIDELRGHLFRSIVAVLIFAVIAFLFKRIIFDEILLSPRESWFPTNRFLCSLSDAWGIEKLCINSKPLVLINIKMAGQFITHLIISVVSGFVIAFPYVVWEVWKFVGPALYKNEKSKSRRLLFVIAVLFFMGILLGYYVIVPIAINFLSNYSVSTTIDNTINLNSYISMITSICFASGIIFELPVLSYFFTKFGLLTPDFMKQYRKHAIIIILMLAAIITPPDMISQLLIGIPLYFLYEVSIHISKVVARKRKETAGD